MARAFENAVARSKQLETSPYDVRWKVCRSKRRPLSHAVGSVRVIGVVRDCVGWGADPGDFKMTKI